MGYNGYQKKNDFSKSPHCWQSVLSFDLNGLICDQIQFKPLMINFCQHKISSSRVCDPIILYYYSHYQQVNYTTLTFSIKLE